MQSCLVGKIGHYICWQTSICLSWIQVLHELFYLDVLLIGTHGHLLHLDGHAILHWLLAPRR